MKAKAKRFEDLVVWQKADQFVLAAYRLIRTFARSEAYGLSSQVRRAAVFIGANIAEGFKKRGRLDKLRFYNIAQGSVEEISVLSDSRQGSRVQRCFRVKPIA